MFRRNHSLTFTHCGVRVVPLSTPPDKAAGTRVNRFPWDVLSRFSGVNTKTAALGPRSSPCLVVWGSVTPFSLTSAGGAGARCPRRPLQRLADAGFPPAVLTGVGSAHRGCDLPCPGDGGCVPTQRNIRLSLPLLPGRVVCFQG